MFEIWAERRLMAWAKKVSGALPACAAGLILMLAVCGCATTVQVSARFPARNPSAAELRKIAVSDFDGIDGANFASALEATLASTQFDGAQYFTVVDSGHRGGRAEARAAAAYGRSVGAQGVFFGQVVAENMHNEGFQGLQSQCVVADANGNCKKYELVSVPCVKRILQMEVIPTLVSVANTQVVYSGRKIATSDASWCQGENPPLSDYQMVTAAQNTILHEIRLDVAPYNATLQATLKESSDGLPEDAAKQFDTAVASAKKHDMGEACRVWGQVDKISPNHPWTVYDLGICSESNGNYADALSLYERARTLSPKADRDIAASIARAQQLLGANGELAREQKVRDDQAAAIRRQAAEQDRQRQTQARADKAAREAQVRADKVNRDAKHAQLVTTFGAQDASLIEVGQVRVGMTAAAVIAARGNPSRREKVPPDSELWHYGSTEIGFTKGKVTHIGQ